MSRERVAPNAAAVLQQVTTNWLAHKILTHPYTVYKGRMTRKRKKNTWCVWTVWTLTFGVDLGWVGLAPPGRERHSPDLTRLKCCLCVRCEIGERWERFSRKFPLNVNKQSCEAIAIRLEVIAIRLEAIALGLEAIAIRL